MKKVLLLVALLFMLVFSVHAADISVSPAKVSVSNMLKEGYAERTFKIRTLTDEPMYVIIDWSDDNIREWTRIVDQYGDELEMGRAYEISSSEPLILTAIIEPTSDIANGNYRSSLFARTSFEGGDTGTTGSKVQVAISIEFRITISDLENLACRAEIGSIIDVEEGDNAFLPVRVMNDGNVRLRPNVKIDIWDYLRERKLSSIVYNEIEIMPTLESEINVELPVQRFAPGQYYVEASIDECSESKDLMFDVKELGEITSQGEIIAMKSPVRSVVGDPVTFSVDFKNTGEKRYVGFFKGGLWLGDKLQNSLESEELEVKPGETVSFDVFTDTKSTGMHHFRGHVYYDRKRTYEQSVILKVFPESMRDEIEALNDQGIDLMEGNGNNESEFYLMYVIFIGIAIVVFLIMRSQKRKRRRRRAY